MTVVDKELDARENKKLFHEIFQTELALKTIGEDIQAMLVNTSVELSKIMRARAQETEIKAYLRGLKFTAEMYVQSAQEVLSTC